MKHLFNIIAWCVGGSIVGFLGTFAFTSLQLYTIGQSLRPWFANHSMPELAVLYSIALTFWLDWLITLSVAIIAAFTVRERLLLKVFVFSVFYIATPWLISGIPTSRGRGLVDLVLFSASVPLLAIVAAVLVRHLRPTRNIQGFGIN
jgi:hypothetical protein